MCPPHFTSALLVLLLLLQGAGLPAQDTSTSTSQPAKKSGSSTPTKKKASPSSSSGSKKAPAKKGHARKKSTAARTIKLHKSFVASSDLRPMARQLIEFRSPAAYAGVEAYAAKHAR